MRVPLKWLSDYVTLRLPEKELAHRLTMAGLEVTSIERIGETWESVFVGEVTDVSPHPNADRLRLATVTLGDEEQTVGCGAPNVAGGSEDRLRKARGPAHRRTHWQVDEVEGGENSWGGIGGHGVLREGVGSFGGARGNTGSFERCATRNTPFADYYGKTVLEIDMKPNRADSLSVLGVARDVAALTGERVREPDLGYQAEGEPVDRLAKVVIEDADLCPRYTATVIEGVKIDSSPPWMQERLSAAGMRPINNVVDVTNYVMLETGQPIHAFDYDTLAEHTIIVRRARKGEKLTTLDGVAHTFGPEHLLNYRSQGAGSGGGGNGRFGHGSHGTNQDHPFGGRDIQPAQHPANRIGSQGSE